MDEQDEIAIEREGMVAEQLEEAPPAQESAPPAEISPPAAAMPAAELEIRVVNCPGCGRRSGTRELVFRCTCGQRINVA